MSVNLDKKLKKAISILEHGGGVSKNSSPKRSREGFAESLNCIRKVIAEEEYWSKLYGTRSINCLFNILDIDDGSLRLLADQCLNAIFRKLILKSYPSKVLVLLLNELSRSGGSARGFAAALNMLPIALKHGREHRLQVYAMHFLHALREALKRPEQAVQSAIETVSGDLIRFFRYDYVDAHEPYANRLMIQCLENLALSGMYTNRAASSVLAALGENLPGMLSLLCGRFIGLFAIIEEGKHKNEIVGLLNALRKMWPALVEDQPQFAVRQIVTKVLGCLNSTLSEIETAALELLYVIVTETPFSMLDFHPLLFKAEHNNEDEKKSSSQLFEMDPLADLNESFISRSSSITSLVESEVTSSRTTTVDENESDADEISNQSGESTPKNRESYVEMDPLFQTDSPAADYLLDKQFENELVISETPVKEEVKGFLCARLPSCNCHPNADFYFYSSTLVADKFLLTGRMGEIRDDVRTSLKILALKYLAAVGAVYEDLTNVTVCADGNSRQTLSDLYQLLSNNDEGLCIATFNLFANLENTYHKNSQKFPSTFYPTGRFLSLTVNLLQNANPRRLKEILQILANNIELVMSDDHLFTTVCDAAIGSSDCDYFLLKIARAEFFAKIKWNCLSPQVASTYQSLCLSNFCRQCFDSDFRVVKSTMDNLKSLVENAEFGFISDVFHVHWDEALFLPSFKPFSQVFALHPNYSFRGESPDLSLEENLSEVLEALTREYVLKPGDRAAGYVNALLVLTRAYPPTVFNGAWGCLNRLGPNQSHPLIGMLVEIAEASTTTLSQLVHILKLIGLIFAGVVENAFIRGANRAEFNKNIAYLEGQQTLDKIVVFYLRLMNLYYTIVKESRTVASTTITSPLFPRINWPSSNEQESSPSYAVSNLIGSGIRPYQSKTSFLNSPSLCLLESTVRGSFSNFMSSMKADVEERIVAPLESAFDGFCCLLEVLPRELLTSFIDELFLYVRTTTNLAVKAVTNMLTQMLKCLFEQNALNINTNLIVLLKSRHSIPPTDQLEMFIGRAINNYSVHVAFLDRFEQMDLHKLKHFGWVNQTSHEQNKQTTEISTYLEQFEKSVTHLLHSYVNISDVESRSAILRLICVLVLNDVRYDKLDPNSRVLNSVLNTVRHEKFKNSDFISTLFTFLCVVSRSIDNLSFDEVIDLACKCADRVNCTKKADVDRVLNALHVVIAEAIAFHSTMAKKLVDILSKPELFERSPAKLTELWTAVLHWSRSTKTSLLWQEMSTNFVDTLFTVIAKPDNELNATDYKSRLELAHSLSIALKTCNPIVFRPINQLFNTFLTSNDLFLCIPFTLLLFCRPDQEELLMQLTEADQNALKLSGRSLATILLRETAALVRNVNKTQLESLENGIAFFGIMLLHILRSESVRSTNFSTILIEEFRSTILDSNEFEHLKLASIAHLHPKVYATWLLLFFQLEIFDETSKSVFSSNLPHHSKQLVALLFLQRLCDERLQINDGILKLFNSVPDEFLVRVLKVARPKQIASIKKRLTSELLGSFVERTRTYLTLHPIAGVFDSVVELSEKDLLNGSDVEDLSLIYNNVQLWISGGKVQAIDAQKPVPPENYSEICRFLMQTTTGLDDIVCLASMALHLDKDQLEDLVKSMKPNWRPIFVTTFFSLLNEEIRRVSNDAYLTGQDADFTPALDLCQMFANLADNSLEFNSSDYRVILLGFHNLPHEIECFSHINLKSLDKILNVCFIKELMEAEIGSNEIDAEFYNALGELFRRGRLDKHFKNDYQTVEHLCLMLRLILDNVERELPKTQRFKINRNHWNVDLLSECTEAERLKDEILECFVLVQRAAHLFLGNFDSPLIESAKNAVLSMLRLPLFSKMFVIPKIALNRDWKLDIVGQKEEIKVALIPIDMLNDPEIIADFVRRILYCGWTSKVQYETWFVTLLGVLCATPTGSALHDEDVQRIADQISASSIAVDALTSMLAQTLLLPKSGDPTKSKFSIKHRLNRDSYLFLQSANGKHAAISRTQIEGGFEPEQVFVYNMERDTFSQKFYSFGQKSVTSLWSMFTEPRSPTGGPNRHSPDIKLDTSSSLKALFENYFHWCRSDLNKLPLPLLTATLRSISILSDMFNDPELYTSVYAEMRNLLDQRTFIDHPIYGYAIYTLLKCLSVLDLDKIGPTRAEICRIIDSYIQIGLSSTSTFVVFGTLHGVLYLIQSANVDDFNGIFVIVFNFLLEEFQRLNTKIDISGDAEPVAYHRLLFTVAFCLAEHHSIDQNLVGRFILLIRTLFVDPRLSEWQRSCLANGIQTLVMHKSSHCESFRDVAVELFNTYQLRPLHLPYALSVYMTCVYRMTQSDRPVKPKLMVGFQSDLQNLLNVFSFYAARKYTQRFLPPIAHLMLTLLKVDQVFEMLLSMIPIQVSGAKPFKLSNYDRSMLCLLFYALRDAYANKQQEIVSYSLKSIFPKIPINEQSSIPAIFTNLLTMSALSADSQTNSLVHVLLRQARPDSSLLRACYSQALTSFKKTAKKHGFTLNEREFPLEPVFENGFS